MRLIFCLLLLMPFTLAAQSFQEQVVELVNDARWDNGQLPPLKSETILSGAAQAYSEAMAVRNFFMHCDPDTGLSTFERMSNAGYAWNNAAENIAAGQSTPAAVMTGWMNSSGHRSNILNAALREIGIGYFNQPGDQNNVRFTNSGGCTPNQSLNAMSRYWTQKFGTRTNVYPLVIAREAYQTNQCAIDLYVHGVGFATQMRFSNNGSNWGDWQLYTPNTPWNLQGAAGATVTVFSQIRNAAGQIRSAQDQIRLQVACGSSSTASRPDSAGKNPSLWRRRGISQEFIASLLF